MLHVEFIKRCNEAGEFWSPCIAVRTMKLPTGVATMFFLHVRKRNAITVPLPLQPVNADTMVNDVAAAPLKMGVDLMF
jgi:hypothetical protein